MSFAMRLFLTAALIGGSGVAMAQDWPTKPISPDRAAGASLHR
jgi:hypothetical protein